MLGVLFVCTFFCLFVHYFVCLYTNSFQMIGPKGLKFLRFDVGYHEVIIRKFSEYWSKTLPVGLYIF